MINKILNTCSICGSNNLTEILELPSLPLTGLYFPSKELARNSTPYDQGLRRCETCGHAQLKTAIDPLKVYDETYTHRSSGSSISKAGNDFLYSYIKKRYKINSDTKLLEIGCNDGYLLKKISQSTDSACGIDPIWLEKEPPSSNSYQIFGGYANNIDRIIPEKLRPNLVISAHTFEHTVSLFEELKCVVDFAEDNAEFIIEMPSFDTLIRLRRFDQVFHQHIQYISESSILELIKRLNCSLLDISYNFNYWGGTVIFSFRKTLSNPLVHITSKRLNLEKVNFALSDFNSFKNMLGRQLEFHDEIYYIGAAQMLPILHYHLKPEIKNLVGILDDNILRIGTYLPSLDVEINSLSNIDLNKTLSSGKIIGAVDSGKALISRAKEIGLSNIYSFYQNII